jgi:cobalt-zinc-cadmium efflux system outer membrane protein
MRLVVCCCLSVCALAHAAASFAQPAPVPITEAEANKRFIAGDARVRAAAAHAAAVRATQAERTLWPNPSFTVSREHVFATDDTFVLARQELPVSGRRQRLQAAGQFAIAAADEEARQLVMALQADVRLAHTALLIAQAREAELRRGGEALQRLVEVLRAREKEGEGSRYDRMRGDRALLDLRAELDQAAAVRIEAQGRLAAFLGPGVAPESIAAAGDVEPRYEPLPIEAAIGRAAATRAEPRASAQLVSQFEAEGRAASRLRIPTPTLSGGLKRGRAAAATSAGYQFAIDLAVPMFNRGQAAAALAAAQQARAAAELAAWRTRIEVEVRTAAAILAIQQQRLARFRQDIADVVQPLAEIGRLGYEEGELGILELLDADRQVLDARLRELDLVSALRRAVIEFDRATGLEQP